MKASKWQRFLIMVRSVWTTFYYSMYVIINSLLGRLTRERVNVAARIWARDLLKIVKARFTIHGKIPVQEPGRRYILMSNHASHYDIPITMCAFSDYCIRMIAKKELFRVPIWGKAMLQAEFMSIDRDNRKQALVDLEVAKEKLSSGITTWAAPEGTRTRSGKMGAFKKGPVVLAIQTEAIIIPFVIEGSRNILPADSWDFSIDESIDIKVGKPIDSKDFTLKQRNELLAKVEQEIHRLIEVE